MVLAFDNGTTNTKAFIFDRRTRILAAGAAPTPTACPGPGMVEQDAEGWWQATVQATRKLDDRFNRKKIEAVSASAQGGTFALLSASLRPLRPGITWLDSRARPDARRLNRLHGKAYFYLRTGHFLGGWAPPAALAWVRRHEPACFAATARLSFVSDFINHRLTGRFFIDHTAAGMTMLYNPVAGCWDRELLDIAGLAPGALPDIVPAGETGGRLTREAARRLGLTAGTPVISGGHDQYCASLGSGAARPGDCLLSCGTAWVLLACLPGPVFRPDTKWAPGRHLAPGAWGLMAAISEGGVMLDWVRKNFRLEEPAPDGHPDPPGTVVFAPGFSRGRGAIRNLDFSSDGRSVYRAALRALAGEVVARLAQVTGEIAVKRILLVGGGSREPLLAPLLREMTGREVLSPPVDEAAARGAALLALKGR